jgi:hypothetical protein
MSKSSESQTIYESEVSEDWLDRFARFEQHFGRFVRDTLGVMLIAAALMTLLALGGYTQGLLLTPWAEWLYLWFGWGAYLVVIVMAYSGYAFLRRDTTPLPWGRIFALEIAACLTLGLLAAIHGDTLPNAQSGIHGGRIGWGMVTLLWRFGKVPGTLIMLIPWVLALMSGLNLWALMERSLLRLAGEAPPPEPAIIQPEVVEQVEEPAAEEKKPKELRMCYAVRLRAEAWAPGGRFRSSRTGSWAPSPRRRPPPQARPHPAG